MKTFALLFLGSSLILFSCDFTFQKEVDYGLQPMQSEVVFSGISDSAWKLVRIEKAWSEEDSISDFKVVLLMENGVFSLILDSNIVLFESNYELSLSKNPQEAIGSYLLNVGSSKYHSIDIINCLLKIFGNGDDMDVYVFEKIPCISN